MIEKVMSSSQKPFPLLVLSFPPFYLESPKTFLDDPLLPLSVHREPQQENPQEQTQLLLARSLSLLPHRIFLSCFVFSLQAHLNVPHSSLRSLRHQAAQMSHEADQLFPPLNQPMVFVRLFQPLFPRSDRKSLQTFQFRFLVPESRSLHDQTKPPLPGLEALHS